MTTQGVGWASEEASDLVASPLNLVLYMHLRIFAYTSNVLIASHKFQIYGVDVGFRYSEKPHVFAKVPFVDRPCAGNEALFFIVFFWLV